MSTRELKRVCVFCGSSQDVEKHYFDLAREVGVMLARQGLGVVYGGGHVGLMGAVADAAMEAGGQVLGVIPQKLQALEVGHHGLTELFVVDNMPSRKSMMYHLSDAFIALPGGLGTLEELFEVTTLTQLNYHLKPVGLVNHQGYFDHLLAFLGHAMDQGFIRPQHRHLIQVDSSPEALLDKLRTCEIPLLEI